MTASRRDILHWTLRGSALLALAPGLMGGRGGAAFAQRRPTAPGLRGYELLDIVPFLGDGRNFVGARSGSGPDARRAFDVSTLTTKKLITPIDEFFIRTGYPSRLQGGTDWRVGVEVPGAPVKSFGLSELASRSEPLGVHLIECAGSTRNSSFGLMSAADWRGVRLAKLLEPLGLGANAKTVLISGVDPTAAGGARPALAAEEAPAAGWIFGLDDLVRAGAALALEMNGVPLPADHGAPVRLIVPGWYGCVWIKWVDRIAFVDDDSGPTLQMMEYASRTGQAGLPEKARDFRPARIEQCAMPVRVEKWRHEGEIFYRVVGILWGGERLIDSLSIGFGADGGLRPVENWRHETNDTWTLWSHTWRPARPGSYQIRLAVEGPGVRPWRMRAGYYDRSVGIDEV